jgi:hypothetical protein
MKLESPDHRQRVAPTYFNAPERHVAYRSGSGHPRVPVLPADCVGRGAVEAICDHNSSLMRLAS